MPTPKENPVPVPNIPAVESHLTPPGSVLSVRMPTDLDAEEAFPLAEGLHRQTGLPVVVLSGDADLTVTTREEAERALAEELFEESEPDAFQLLAARRRLTRLRNEGWELVRVSQP